MKKLLLYLSFGAFLLSCNNDKDKTAATVTTDSTVKSTVELPYTASYSSSWSTDVPDADLKMVLMTYKDWADNNMSGLGAGFADTVAVDFSSGANVRLPKADIMKLFTTFRDSLSSVTIEMLAWHKMYSTDKKDGSIVTWYDETDTYKNGKVDSASYHDINMVKDGKIIWYAQYKRPKKPKK
jgi:hypothetical protein